MSKNSSTNKVSNDYQEYDPSGQANALIMPSKSNKVKKTEKKPEQKVSKEVLKKLAQLERKHRSQAIRAESLNVINSNSFDDHNRILLNKSANLGSRRTHQEQLAYSYQAAKANLSLDDDKKERLDVALAEQGDYMAVHKYQSKKKGQQSDEHFNPFLKLSSTNQSYTSISKDRKVKYTRAELAKFASEMGKNLVVDEAMKKREAKKLRREERRILDEHGYEQNSVVFLPSTLSHLTNKNSNTDFLAVTSSSDHVVSNPVSSIAQIAQNASLSSLAASNVLNSGIANKKRKAAIQTLFEADDFSESEDEEEPEAPVVKVQVKEFMSAAEAKKMEEDKRLAEQEKALEMIKQNDKNRATIGTGPTVIRTDKAAVRSRDITTVIAAPIIVKGSTNKTVDSSNPYAVNFKVLSAKPVAKRAAAALERSTMTDDQKKRFDKKTSHLNKDKILISHDSDSEEEEDEDDDEEEEESEDEGAVKFESWDLVKQVNLLENKPKKVLFDASKGGLMTKSIVIGTQTNKTTPTPKSSMNDEENSDMDDQDDMNDDEEVGDEDDMMIEYEDGEDEDEDGDEDDEDCEEDEDDEDYEEDEDEDDMDDVEEKPISVDDLAPPKKGLRFDGSQMSFQELLSRVTADLFADSDDEENNEDTEMIIYEEPPVKKQKVEKVKKTEKKVDITKTKTTPVEKSRTPVVRNQKFSVPVQRKPEIENSRLQLPVCGMEQEISEAIMYNDILILSGETGSGKTTQVPQFLYESGYGRDGMIAITQPRRVAAMSSAKRVSEELSLENTSIVGYQIRYDSQVKADTQIKMMTEGILLKEIQQDFLLRKYSVIIIDEAHERGLNTDVLLGLLSRIVKLRNQLVDEQLAREGGNLNTQDNIHLESSMSEGNSLSELSQGKGLVTKNLKTTGISQGKLKIVIMSATLRVTDFTANPRLFPIPPPVLNVPSRQYPVAMHFSRVTAEDYTEKALQKVARVHTRLPPGAILVFLTGRQEIEVFCKKLREIFPAPQPGMNNSVESYVQIGASNVKSKAIKNLKSRGESINLKDPKVMKRIDAEMLKIRVAAQNSKKTKIVYKKGTPFSLEDIARDERGETLEDAEMVNVDDEAELKKAVIDMLDLNPVKEDMNEDEDEEERKKEEEEMMFELSDDDDYDDDEDDEDDEEEDEDNEDEDGEKKTITSGKNKTIKKKKNESSYDAEKRAGSSVNNKWEEELENLKKQEFKPPMLVLPLYALLSTEQQMMVFNHEQYTYGARLVVVSTNVAETSVTIPGIRYVVDTGREKRKTYDQITGSSKFEVGFIAQSSSNQRAGRAGRTGPGHCYRLFSGAVFDEHFPKHAEPEILQQPIESTILQMKSMGINDVVNFPFPTPPSIHAVRKACHTLYLLGALEQLLGRIQAQKLVQYKKEQEMVNKLTMKSTTTDSNSFLIAKPKSTWELLEEQQQQRQAEEELEKQVKNMKQSFTERDEEEAAAVDRILEDNDASFCIHGKEYVDTTNLGITTVGKTMSIFPLHPRFAKLLLTAANQPGCLPLAIAMTCILTVNELVVKPGVVKKYEEVVNQEKFKKAQAEKNGEMVDSDEDDESESESESESEDETLDRAALALKRKREAIANEKRKSAENLARRQAKKDERAKGKAEWERWVASRARWTVKHSDILSTLRMVGAYLHMRHSYSVKQWKLMKHQPKYRLINKPMCFETLPFYFKQQVLQKMQKFCDDNFIRHKAMKELLLLREQLSRIVMQRVQASMSGKSGLFHSNSENTSLVGGGDIDENEDADVADNSSTSELVQQNAELIFDYTTNSNSDENSSKSVAQELVTSVKAPLLMLPTESQELALTQILTTGFIDKIARRMTDETKATIIRNTHMYSLVPQPRYYPRDIRSKLEKARTETEKHELLQDIKLNIRDLDDAYELLETGEPVFLSPDSVLSSSAPEYVLYSEVSKNVGRRSRTVISGLTAIKGEWLATLASSLCSFSKPLEEPLPVFDTARDQVMAYVTVLMGASQWELPLSKQPFEDEEVEEIKTAIVADPKKRGSTKQVNKLVKTMKKPYLYHRHLARCLLEGTVIPKLKTMRPYYSGRTTAPMASTLTPQANALITAFREKNITGVKDMHRIWYGEPKNNIRGQPNWLLDEMLLWIHSSKKIELKKMWPPIDRNHQF